MLNEGKRDGGTYNKGRDYERLNRQAIVVFELMRDGQWRTLEQISDQTGEREASVSARLRDFRKDRFGGHTVEREYVSGGLHMYRLKINFEPRAQQEMHW